MNIAQATISEMISCRRGGRAPASILTPALSGSRAGTLAPFVNRMEGGSMGPDLRRGGHLGRGGRRPDLHQFGVLGRTGPGALFSLVLPHAL